MNAQALINIVIPLAFLAIFYFILIRPQQKREKSVKSMRESLKVGDQVSTIGGILGKITKVNEDSVVIEIGADKTKLTIERWGVGRVISSKE